MKTEKQKETNEKEVHLLEQKPTQKAVKDAVKELNPDTNSLGSRG